MVPASTYPPVRACLFDMDGLLINTEDIYTKVVGIILKEYGRPPMPWSVKAQLQGRPADAATEIFLEWAQLPISKAEYLLRLSELHREHFPACVALPGVPELLETLSTASPASMPTEKVEIALATSSISRNVKYKTSHLQDLFEYFPLGQKIMGDDPRIPKGRGKPAPDIYLVALEAVNARRRGEGKDEINPVECLVFEDSVPGCESGRRAGMRVVWVPHPQLLTEFEGKEEEVLAGMGEGDRDDGQVGASEGLGKLGEIGDGGGEMRVSLEGFDYGRYGIIPK